MLSNAKVTSPKKKDAFQTVWVVKLYCLPSFTFNPGPASFYFPFKDNRFLWQGWPSSVSFGSFCTVIFYEVIFLRLSNVQAHLDGLRPRSVLSWDCLGVSPDGSGGDGKGHKINIKLCFLLLPRDDAQVDLCEGRKELFSVVCSKFCGEIVSFFENQLILRAGWSPSLSLRQS